MNNISANNIENKAATPRVIVSLTTYPGRIDRVNIAIESLLHQSRPANMVVLWLAESQFPGGENSLPPRLLEQKERGLHIEWCKDIKSYKKLIPSLKKWPDDIIITADDDIVYRSDVIENLLESYDRHPDCVSTVRAHLMIFDESGFPLPYNDWKPEYSEFIGRPLMSLFPTTGAGTLFPPHILPDEVFNEETFMSLCSKADDIWIKCMLTLAGVPVVLACENTRLLLVEGTQEETLYSHNLTENDTQLEAVLNVYNEVGGEEHPEETLIGRMNDLPGHASDNAFCQKYRVSRSFANEQRGVRVSVIISTNNDEKWIKRCLSSAISQSISDIEIICVDNASTDGTVCAIREFTEKDSRVVLIELDEKCSVTAARRAAVLNSRGEYCVFPEAKGVLAPDACEQLYERAEQGDTDIFEFTSGVISGTSEPTQSFSGFSGRLRNTKILPTIFGKTVPMHNLHSCIASGRLCRKAYYHALTEQNCESMYEYFLLTRNAEVYVGEDTPIFYAAPQKAECPMATSASIKAMNEYIQFGRLENELFSVIDNLRHRCIERNIREMSSLSFNERQERLKLLGKAWSAAELAAAIAESSETVGPNLIASILDSPIFKAKREKIKSVGVLITEKKSASTLFTVTETLDCIAMSHTTALIGMNKAAASAAVSSAKTTFVCPELTEDDTANAYAFADCIDKALNSELLDAIVIPINSKRCMQTIIHAKLLGKAVVLLLTGLLYSPMLHCSQPAASISAIRMADAVITDSQTQEQMIKSLGINCRFIPSPDIRLMGGRSSRASANGVVWVGTSEELPEAVDIFTRIRNKLPEARMQIYLDGTDAERDEFLLPEGTTVRRLRADYGIYSDAAVHLMTQKAGTEPTELRAARTLGVPTVMYQLIGGQTGIKGAIEVQRSDRAAAANMVIRLLEDRSEREALAAEAKAASHGNSREKTAELWAGVFDEIASGKWADKAVRNDPLEDVLTAYEEGAHVNALELQEYRRRCEAYEQKLAAAEERRVKETEALKVVIGQKEETIREKEKARSKVSGELNELRGSTLYKVGAAVTAVPRKLKKLLGKESLESKTEK